MVLKNGDLDETMESETGSVSVATSSDLASPAKVIVLSLSLSLSLFKPLLHIVDKGL